MELLAHYPHIGRARGDLLAGVRHVVVGQYLLLYRVTEDGIEISRVLHGKRAMSAKDVIS